MILLKEIYCWKKYCFCFKDICIKNRSILFSVDNLFFVVCYFFSIYKDIQSSNNNNDDVFIRKSIREKNLFFLYLVFLISFCFLLCISYIIFGVYFCVFGRRSNEIWKIKSPKKKRILLCLKDTEPFCCALEKNYY